jgi:hypothetical protein
LDVLRQEVELLKLKLQLVEQKLKKQDDELRALRADGKGGAKKEPAGVSEALLETIRKQKADDAESLRKAEDRSLESRKLTNLEDELKALRDAERKANDLRLLKDLEDVRLSQPADKNRGLLGQQTKPDPLHEAEAALKALREARDTEAQRKAADRLEKALKRLREQQKKEKPDAPRP